MNRLKENWLIIGVLIIAFLLRFIPLFSYEFSFDELSALDRTRFTNLHDLIQKGVLIDAHPALIQVFLFYWIKIGGSSEAWVKLPFLLCGFLSCHSIFAFSKKWFGYKTGVFASVVMSCSMIFVIYSSYARMYAPGVLFSIITLYYIFEIAFGHSTRFKDYFLLALFLWLGALNNHMGSLFGLLIFMGGFIISAKKQKIYLVYTGLAALVCYLPHLPVTLTQLGYSIAESQGGWLPMPKWYACFSFLKALFGTGMLIYVFLLLLLIAGIKNKFSFVKDQKIIFLFITFGMYCLVIQLYSILRAPILQFSVLLIAAPCIVIVVAKGLSLIPSRFFNALCVALVLILLAQAIFIKQFYSLGITQSNRSGVVETIKAKEQYGSDQVTAVYGVESFFVKHYMNEFKKDYTFLSASDSVFKNPALLNNYLKSLKENYIVLSDPDIFLLETTKLYFPYLIRHDEGYFKCIFMFSKTNIGSIPDETVVKVNTLNNPGSFILPEKYATIDHSVLIDSTNEFPFMVYSNFDSLRLKEGEYMVCSSAFIPQNKMDNLSFDFSIKKNDSTLFYTGKNLRDFYNPLDSIQHGFSVMYIGTEINNWKGSTLAGYFWNSGKKRYLVKDFQIKTLDINPHKYLLWN